MYNVPRVKCELLGQHLENLRDVLYFLNTLPLEEKYLYEHIRPYSIQDTKPLLGRLPSWVAGWLGQSVIDIDVCVRCELARFPRLNFLEHAFDDFFRQIKKPLRLVFDKPIDDLPFDVTVGRYMKELALLRREFESQPITSKWEEEIRQELKKYEYLLPDNQRIDDIFDVIEKVLNKHEKKNKTVKEVKTLETTIKTGCDGFGLTQKNS